MKEIELAVKTSGKINAPWYIGYMKIEYDANSFKFIKRYFVRKEEYNENKETTITMIREYKTRNALMNYMRRLPNN